MSKSPLEDFMETPGFKPFREPEAKTVLDKLKEMIKPTAPFTEEDIRKAVETLSAITEPDIAFMASVQNDFCTKCGRCCRITCSPINFKKEELKAAAEHLGTSYKELKKKIRAVPTGRGSLNIPGKPCPFLKGRNHCIIYEVRPVVCRIYPMSFTVLSLVENDTMAKMANDCSAVDDMLAHVALSRLIREYMFREAPEEYERLQEYGEKLWKGVPELPTRLDRFKASMEIYQRVKG